MNKKILTFAIALATINISAEFIMKQSVQKGITFSVQESGFAGYSFTSHTFSNCGKKGRYGPTLLECTTAYNTSWDEDINNFNMTTQGYQEWTVPETGIYRINIAGARGGDNSGGANLGGYGVILVGDFSLTKGEIINILVGQMGEGSNNRINSSENMYDGGGGGGSFVWKKDESVPLIVAGGGGGSIYEFYSKTIADASLYTYGKSNTAYGSGDYTARYSGGINGNGGNGGGSYHGGGGGGWLTSGGSFSGNGGKSILNHGGIGGAGETNSQPAGEGGFGGGGGAQRQNASGAQGPGGGGGYSGGAGASDMAAGGGGSYNSGENQSNSGASNTSNGYVTITKL